MDNYAWKLFNAFFRRVQKYEISKLSILAKKTENSNKVEDWNPILPILYYSNLT